MKTNGRVNQDSPLTLLHPVKKIATNQQVLSSLKAFLQHENLKVGCKLPSERKLAKMLNVSRPSIREVTSALGFLGIVKSKQGDGTYLVASLRKLLSQPDHLFTLQQSLDLAEVAEARSAIEPFVASLAATRITNEDLRALGKYLKGMKTGSKIDRTLFWHSDRQFHLRIAQACGNHVLKRMMSAVMENLREYFEAVQHKYQGDLTEVLVVHEGVFDALRRRDKDQAHSAMTRHMEMSRRITTEWARQVAALGRKQSGATKGRSEESGIS